MNWQAAPQRPGSLDREMPQSVHRSRGRAGPIGGAHTGADPPKVGPSSTGMPRDDKTGRTMANRIAPRGRSAIAPSVRGGFARPPPAPLLALASAFAIRRAAVTVGLILTWVFWPVLAGVAVCKGQRGFAWVSVAAPFAVTALLYGLSRVDPDMPLFMSLFVHGIVGSRLIAEAFRDPE